MKKLMIIAASLAVIASPALAKPAKPVHQDHVVQTAVQAQQDVYFAGTYLGRDPDLNIRISLEHNYPFGD